MTTTRRLPTVGGVLCLILFVGLACAVGAVPAVAEIDAAVDAALAPMRTVPMIAVFLWVTTLGSGAALFAVAAAATGLLWVGAGRRFMAPFWTVYLGTEATTWGAKFALDRARPAFLEIAHATSPSFPSAHAAGSAAVYGFLAYMIVRQLPGTRPGRPAVLGATVLVISAVAFSRVFLGVHFPSDVVGGLLVAGIWLCVGIGMVRGPSPSPGGT